MAAKLAGKIAVVTGELNDGLLKNVYELMKVAKKNFQMVCFSIPQLLLAMVKIH